jgi:hypothetical protein
MMATAFLGNQHSPKWFDISNKESVSFNKKNVMNYKVNNIRLFNKSIIKRGYSTSSSSDRITMSERLETIERVREKALARPPMSDETKKKCIVNTRPVVLYNLDKTIYGKYPTILEASKAINCDEKTIRRALQTEKKLVKRQ